MKGIFLAGAGSEPVYRTDLVEPQIRPGAVILRMLAVPVLSYTRQVFNGNLKYVMPEAFIPGNSGVGVIETVADDVFHLRVGQRVGVDPRVTPHTTTEPAEAGSILIGLTASTPASQKLQAIWKNGSYAEKALLPAECVTPLDSLPQIPAERLALLSHFAIPYGGLLRGELAPGQSVIINGATGTFGARAIQVALAMGAAKVIAVGRDEAMLQALVALAPKRIVSASLQKGDIANSTKTIRYAAGGQPADLYFDMLGRAQEPDSILACMQALRHRGTAIFMGGVRIPVPLDYSLLMRNELTLRGNFMYPRHAIASLVRLAEAGLLDLQKVETRTFPLEQFAAACDFAEQATGLESAMVCPT